MCSSFLAFVAFSNGKPDSTFPENALANRLGEALRRPRTIRELEELPNQSRRHHRDRIDAQDRRVRRAGHFVRQPDEPLIAAATEEQPEYGNLAEHVVEAEERHEGT